MKKLLIFFIFLISNYCIAKQYDSLQQVKVSQRLDQLDDQLKEVRRDELNYRLEKDLLKETYSNSYERISLIITIVLGIIGILGYLGIKDINSIKKEYEQELNNLKNVQEKFNTKALEFDTEKKKFESDLKEILKENEEQNKKIKFIELKDKARTLLEDDKLTPALEFANAALQINDKDSDLLNQKGQILCRLNQTTEAVKVFKEVLLLNPDNDSTILNSVECFYFANDISLAKKLIEEHRTLFENKSGGRLLELFELFEIFHSGNNDRLLEIAKSYVSSQNLNENIKRISGWILKESLYFAHYQKDSELKYSLQNILWYWDAQINGKELLTRLNIDLPIAEI